MSGLRGAIGLRCPFDARETKLLRSDRGLFEALKEDTPNLRLPSFALEDHDEIELGGKHIVLELNG
jgi:hypothetical protein